MTQVQREIFPLSSHSRTVNGTDTAAVLDRIPAQVSVWTRDLHCVYANQAAVASFCRPHLRTVRGQSLATVLGRDAFEIYLPHTVAALAGQRAEFDVLTFRSAGQPAQQIHVLITPIPHLPPDEADSREVGSEPGTIQIFAVAGSDALITQQRALRAAEARGVRSAQADRDAMQEQLIRRLFSITLNLSGLINSAPRQVGDRLSAVIDDVDRVIHDLRRDSPDARTQLARRGR
jgi:PAS fold